MDERAKASQTRLDVLHVYLLEAANALADASEELTDANWNKEKLTRLQNRLLRVNALTCNALTTINDEINSRSVMTFLTKAKKNAGVNGNPQET